MNSLNRKEHENEYIHNVMDMNEHVISIQLVPDSIPPLQDSYFVIAPPQGAPDDVDDNRGIHTESFQELRHKRTRAKTLPKGERLRCPWLKS